MRLVPVVCLTVMLFADAQAAVEPSETESLPRLVQSSEPPVVPVGLDAYRMWDRLPDHRDARMHFPAEEDHVRIMRGTSTFKMRVDPNNLGVLLRRKFDYQYPNQRAHVFVRSDCEDTAWQFVGQWYTAGSNTCVYSYPRKEGELGKTQQIVITSNRRWREEEFLVPRHLTEGVGRLEIKIDFIPSDKQLFPGHPFPAESAWSESRYWAYCYKLPEVKLPER